MNGYQDFLRGRLSTGFPSPATEDCFWDPHSTTLFDSGQAEIWSVAQAPDGSLYLGTGNRGRVSASTQRARARWCGPPISRRFSRSRWIQGRGLRRHVAGRQSVSHRKREGRRVFRSGRAYIWALAVAPDGALMVGDRRSGKDFSRDRARAGQRVLRDRPGARDLRWRSMRKAACSRAASRTGFCIASRRQGKAFVLYDSSLPEIRAIVPAPGWHASTRRRWAAASRDARERGQCGRASTSSLAAPAPTFSTTVTDDRAGRHQSTPQAGGAEAGRAPAPRPPVIASRAPAPKRRAEKSALYKIHPTIRWKRCGVRRKKTSTTCGLRINDALFSPMRRAEFTVWTATARRRWSRRPTKATPRGLLDSDGSARGDRQSRKDSAARSGAEQATDGSNRRCTIRRRGAVGPDFRGAGTRRLAFRTRTGIRRGRMPPGATGRPRYRLDESRDHQSQRALHPMARGVHAGTPAQGPAIDNVTIAYLPQNTPPVVRALSGHGHCGGQDRQPPAHGRRRKPSGAVPEQQISGRLARPTIPTATG